MAPPFFGRLGIYGRGKRVPLAQASAVVAQLRVVHRALSGARRRPGHFRRCGEHGEGAPPLFPGLASVASPT
eukprot:10773730-Lingulodinium_polyedra.AAC.1